MASFSELILYLLMIAQIACQTFDKLSHLMVAVHLVLCLLWLVFELTGQRRILNNSKFRCAHELVLIHAQHLDFNCTDL